MTTFRVRELDQLFELYYTSKQRDYENGKFQSFCSEKQIDDTKLQLVIDQITKRQWNGYWKSVGKFFRILSKNGQIPCFIPLSPPKQSHGGQLRSQFAHLFVQFYHLRSVPSDNELRMSYLETQKHESIDELDQLLGEYYASKNYKNYFDETGRGKFRLFIVTRGWNDDQWNSYITGHNRIDDLRTWMLDDIFHPNDDFPCFHRSTADNSVHEHAPRTLQRGHFAHIFMKLYHLRMVPSDDELRMSFFRESISWTQIAESLKHEMYSAISTKMHEVIDDIKSTEIMAVDHIGEDAVDQFIDLLEGKITVSNKEAIFIQNAVARARGFRLVKGNTSMS